MVAKVVDIEAVKKDFAKRLKAARLAMGMTQEQAAPFCGVTLRTYGLWELGRQLPEGENAVLVEVRMGVPLIERKGRSTDRTTGRYPGDPGWPMAERTLDVAHA